MDLVWLKKRAKQVHRATGGTLAAAQLALAREHGFASWRALKAHVETARVERRDVENAERIAAFLRLVGEGDLAGVKARLADDPGLVNAIGPHPFWGGRPQPLHVAIETDRFEMVTLLLRAGADVDGSNAEYAHWSPLMIALASPKRFRSKRALLRRGAKIDLAAALLKGDDARTLKLLRRGRAAIAGPIPNDGSWLALARTTAAIDRLLALGAPIESRDRWGTAPMEALSRTGKASLVRHLATRGVVVDPDVFARLGDRRTLARLIAADPEVVRRADVVKSAVDFGHRALVGWLIERGADPNARSTTRTSHDTCLHSAAWNGDLEMAELLLERGADRELLDDDHHNTPAGWADVSARITNNPRCLEVAERIRSYRRPPGRSTSE